MQLGARWRVGDPPHRGVPQQLHAAISESEVAHPSGTAWTLTWLEGRPRVELFGDDADALDDIRVDASGQISRSRIHAGHGVDAQGDDSVAGSHDDDDDDDDWLM